MAKLLTLCNAITTRYCSLPPELSHLWELSLYQVLTGKHCPVSLHVPVTVLSLPAPSEIT